MSLTEIDRYRITLDSIAAEPERALDLPVGEAMALLLRASSAQAALLTRVASANSANSTQAGREVEAADPTLSIAEIAALLKRPAAWIVRNRQKLPFIHQVSPKTFVASERAVRRWLNTRRS